MCCSRQAQIISLMQRWGERRSPCSAGPVPGPLLPLAVLLTTGPPLIPLAHTLHRHWEVNGATTSGLSHVRDTIYSEQGTSCCSNVNFFPCWGKLGLLNPGTSMEICGSPSAFCGEYIMLATSQRRCLVSVPQTAGVPCALRDWRLSSKLHAWHGCAFRSHAHSPVVLLHQLTATQQ